MKFRALSLLAVCGALLFVLVEGLLRGSPAHPIFVRSEIELVKTLAMLGALAAAVTFGRGDYMRRAWIYVAGCMFLLLLRDFFFLGLGWHAETALSRLSSASFTALANLASVVGTFMLAKAWRVSGLQLPGTRLTQILTVGGGTALALGFGGPPVVSNVSQVLAGNHVAAVWLASSIGDLITFLLLAPLLLTAVALRGGLLGWPWALLTLSSLAWIGYDAFLVLGPIFEADAVTIRAGTEFCRSLACLFGGAAGVSQRWVIMNMRSQQP